MLLDRGLLSEDEGVYRPTGEVAELDVPETLHGLIAARLDGLSAEERRLLQDGSVLGKTFTKESLAELSGMSEADLDPLLAGLVRKEVLGVQADPRSPERGQYGFLQDLVRRVAYETLARRDRKARHLGAAAQLERSFGAAEQEVVEVVAAHYLAAYEAQPDADDALEIKARARRAPGASRRARGIARRARGGAPLLRAGGGALGRAGGESSSSGAGEREGLGQRGVRGGRAGLCAQLWSSSSRRASCTRRPASPGDSGISKC